MKQIFLSFLVVALIVGQRLVPHEPNISAVLAVSLFAGAYLSEKWATMSVFGALVLSDAILKNERFGIMAFVYGALLLIAIMGFALKGKVRVGNVIGLSIVSAIAFFLITNFGVWVLPDSFYPHTRAGLIECFAAAVPFFWRTLASTLVSSAVLFGLYEASRFVLRFFKSDYLAA
ncbi:hypothetical protein M1432_02150 [Patescibacteria group bacterium]|nr:hypothetical protein [Patescibacteria group bacterium]